MGADEEGTHERLTAHLGELVNPKIRQHRGRIVKNTGDGFLAEFASVVDAVRWAAEIQRGMIDREPEAPEKRRIRFRIGINLGDVIAEEYDIFGDGVNVAARLEALAEPGGICVSRIVRDQVCDRFDFVFEDLGEQQVKNLARPVRVYRVLDRAAAVAELFIVPTQPSGGRVRITAQPLDAVTGTISGPIGSTARKKTYSSFRTRGHWPSPASSNRPWKLRRSAARPTGERTILRPTRCPYMQFRIGSHGRGRGSSKGSTCSGGRSSAIRLMAPLSRWRRSAAKISTSTGGATSQRRTARRVCISLDRRLGSRVMIRASSPAQPMYSLTSGRISMPPSN
jgi:hypothetical protein